MERDFLGLNSKESVRKDECDNNDGSGKGLGVHQPIPRRISSAPYMMSFRPSQEAKDKKVELDSSVPQFAFTSSDAFERFQIRSSCQTQNLPAPMNQQQIGRMPVAASHPVLPLTDFTAGANQRWRDSRTSGSSSQLTIFCAGSVRVYDDVSPEKAQAIMLLAGNESSRPATVFNPKPQSQVPNSRSAGCVGSGLNTSLNCSHLRPMSVSSPTGAQSGSGSTSTDEQIASRPVGLPSTPISRIDRPRVLTGLGPVSVSAAPLARKASLARFLEKRKERVMNAVPYSTKPPERHKNFNGSSTTSGQNVPAMLLTGV